MLQSFNTLYNIKQCLQISKILMKFAYKLCIAVILVVFIFTAKLLKINDMRNFFNINLLTC